MNDLQTKPETEILPKANKASALVEAFLSGRNEKTIKAYRQALEHFATFAEKLTVEEAAQELLQKELGDANQLVLMYKKEMKKKGLSAATINHRLAALRSLTKLGRMLGLVSWALEIENTKVEPYRDTRGPGKEGVQKMLKELSTRLDDKAARDTAMVHLLYDMALRAFEVVGLDLADVKLEKSELWVLGKGRQQRERFTLAPETKDALKAWIKVRGNEAGPLFTNFDPAGKGHRLTTTGLYLMIRGLGEKVGEKTRPHGLRHAAITEALEQTQGDVRRVAKYSRHKDLRVLVVYDDARKDIAGEVSKLVAKST